MSNHFKTQHLSQEIETSTTQNTTHYENKFKSATPGCSSKDLGDPSSILVSLKSVQQFFCNLADTPQTNHSNPLQPYKMLMNVTGKKNTGKKYNYIYKHES